MLRRHSIFGRQAVQGPPETRNLKPETKINRCTTRDKELGTRDLLEYFSHLKTFFYLVPKSNPMKRLLLLPLMLLLFATSCGSRPASVAGPEKSKTYVMIVGVLKWQNPGLSSFSDVHRKDQELYDVLIKQGIPKEQTVLLLDEAATLASIKKEYEALLAKVPSDGTFIFYYAGHGTKEKNGQTYFANYDINLSNLESSGLSASYLGETIRSKYKGSMIWLTADCCYSGSLIEEGKKMGNLKTLVSTSATASNSSTANWTFTQTMIDCLSGLPLADHDANGSITAGEWKKELEQAMLYREKQRAGFALFGVGNDYVIGTTSGTAEKSDATFPAGTYGQAYYEKQWQPVRILGKSGDQYNCELYHYSDKEEVLLGADALKKAHFVSYPVNTKVQVLWEGTYYEALIKQSVDGFHYITYPGYDAYWDEWVMYDRIKTGKEKAAKVEWRGDWYDALVLEEKDGNYFIHYTADSYEWDEWVGSDRIRF
jgi:hypothetical protein